MRTVYVSDFPAVQHRHEGGAIVTVKLRRVAGGGHKASCAGCGTTFIYRKPRPSGVRHYKSPLLPNVKGNFDSGDDH